MKRNKARLTGGERKMTCGSQESRHGISTSAHANAAASVHAGKFAYPVKPLNVESLDRPILAYKKRGNHRAGVIVGPAVVPRCDSLPQYDARPVQVGIRSLFE